MSSWSSVDETRYAPTDNDLTAARYDSPSLNKLQLKSKQLFSSDKLKAVFRGNLSKAQNGEKRPLICSSSWFRSYLTD